MGMLPSASLGDSAQGLYEPIHGSAPDIAGKDLANPCGAIQSAALLLRHSLGLEEEAKSVERAVAEAIAAGARTADIAGPGEITIGTSTMTAQILTAIN
jgi:3-isopropylmalate dehydrogenase